MKTNLRSIDAAVCLMMAAIIYTVFPLRRWADHAPLCTALLLGFYFMCYTVTRALCIPGFFGGRKRTLRSILILAALAALMAALNNDRSGWPLRLLDDFENVNRNLQMSRERAWLFFLVVETAAAAVGVVSELKRQQKLAARPQESGEQVAEPRTLCVRSGRKTVPVDLSEVLYIEAMDNYVRLTLTGGRQVKTQATLNGFTARLPAEEFVRIHKSYVVSRSHITSFNRRQVTVGGVPFPLPVGRTYVENVRKI